MTNDTLWWQHGIIYQIYPRSFQDSNGDGIGDLNGIRQRLDYLQWLGVNAIWISPIFQSPMADFGYDVADYKAIDPIFGSLADMEALIEAAHQHDIRIILDFVPAHTSDRHAWFQESRASRDNPKRDWYIWRDPKDDGSLPNNWGSYFGGPAWTLDEATGQYYLHQFDPKQPELNWRNPEVKEAMFDTVRFWLDRGVDGFRMDVVGFIIKDEALRDNPINPDAPDNLPDNDLLSRLIPKYSQNQTETHSLLQELRQLVDSYDDRCLIGEIWAPLETWATYYGQVGREEIQLPFNFNLLLLGWDVQAIKASVSATEAILPNHAWPNYVLGNHDFPRLASRYGSELQARLAAMMLLTLRGTPTLYYGDELGMPNISLTQEQVQDPQGIRLGVARSRDVARSPMAWDDGQFAGFSTVEPWLPLHDDYEKRNVYTQNLIPNSILNLYRRLLRLRRSSMALRRGEYRAVEAPDEWFAYVREVGESGERYLILLNFSPEEMTAQMASAASSLEGKIQLSTYMDRSQDHRKSTISLSQVTLRGYEGLILSL